MGWTKRLGVGLGMAVALGTLGSVSYAHYRDNSEEPAFTVVKTDNAFELRDYEPMIVAEVTHSGDRRRASGRSFRRLAAYIFSQDRPEGGEKIAMTSPVIQEETETDTWRMRFVMPAKYTMETLPTAPEDIKITKVPGRRLATVKFNGYGSASDLVQMEEFLTDWIANEGLTPKGDFEYAFYDAPMVPGRMRRNEVMMEVVVP